VLRRRRAAAARQLDERRSAQALADLALLPLQRVGHLSLLDRIWQLRDNVTVYDGGYAAGDGTGLRACAVTPAARRPRRALLSRGNALTAAAARRPPP